MISLSIKDVQANEIVLLSSGREAFMNYLLHLSPTVLYVA